MIKITHLEALTGRMWLVLLWQLYVVLMQVHQFGPDISVCLLWWFGKPEKKKKKTATSTVLIQTTHEHLQITGRIHWSKPRSQSSDALNTQIIKLIPRVFPMHVGRDKFYSHIVHRRCRLLQQERCRAGSLYLLLLARWTCEPQAHALVF